MRNTEDTSNVTPIRPAMPVGRLPEAPRLFDHSKPVSFGDLLLIAGRIDEIRRDNECSTAEAMVIAIVDDMDAA
ncbi:hypothetical protein FF80_01886 [Devosia sp. LC5]|nr:hypothetical protein FF80_01886 [Devosia sp. LC5]